MEKDVLQYLIIIVAVVIWVISKMSKVTKSVKMDTSTPPPVVLTPKQNEDLDDWWKEVSQEMETKTVPKPAVQKVKNQAIDKVESDYFEKLHKNYKNAEFALKHKPLQQLEVIDTDGKDHSVKPLNIDLKHNDEIRRAFVYSEIFNRKY